MITLNLTVLPRLMIEMVSRMVLVAQCVSGKEQRSKSGRCVSRGNETTPTKQRRPFPIVYRRDLKSQHLGTTTTRTRDTKCATRQRTGGAGKDRRQSQSRDASC